MSGLGLPAMRAEYESRFTGVEKVAEYERVNRLIDNGHEFAALMERGGTVQIGGQWRTIDAVESVSGARVLLVCMDGTEWLARRAANRPYLPPERAS